MDRITNPKQVERVLCFSEKRGKLIWSHTYDCPYRTVSYTAGPPTSVQIHDGVAYSLGMMGHLFAFKALDGRVPWSHDLHTDYEIDIPEWGISAAPDHGVYARRPDRRHNGRDGRRLQPRGWPRELAGTQRSRILLSARDGSLGQEGCHCILDR